MLAKYFDLDKSDEKLRTRLFNAFVGSDAASARPLAQGPADLKQVADALEKSGNHEAALEVLGEISVADPANLEIKANLAKAHLARGEFDKAKAFLSPEIAGANPALWMMLAEMELLAGRFGEGKTALREAIKLDKAQAQAAVVLSGKLARPTRMQVIKPSMRSSKARWPKCFAAAAAALQEFTTHVQSHIVGLMRLVEICVDGGIEATMYEAQAQLAEAYLAGGRALEARIISEDLVAREPWNKANSIGSGARSSRSARPIPTRSSRIA